MKKVLFLGLILIVLVSGCVDDEREADILDHAIENDLVDCCVECEQGTEGCLYFGNGVHCLEPESSEQCTDGFNNILGTDEPLEFPVENYFRPGRNFTADNEEELEREIELNQFCVDKGYGYSDEGWYYSDHGILVDGVSIDSIYGCALSCDMDIPSTICNTIKSDGFIWEECNPNPEYKREEFNCSDFKEWLIKNYGKEVVEE